MPSAPSLFTEAHWVSAEARVLHEAPPLPGDVWAERNIHLPRVKNPEPGPLRLDRSPYLSDILVTLTQPYVREGCIQAANQLGKSMLGHILAGYFAEQEYGSIIIIHPDEKTAGRLTREKIRPLWQESPALHALSHGVKDPYKADEFQFNNGVSLYLAWTTAAKLAGITAAVLIYDEVNKYPKMVGNDGTVFDLGAARKRVFPYTYKTLKISTPTDSEGHISTALREECDEVRKFRFCCPVCGEFQRVSFLQVKWPEAIRDHREVLRERAAWYECAHCGAHWDDHQRDRACLLGEWRPCHPGELSADKAERAAAALLPPPEPLERPRAVGWQLPAMLSHFVPLAETAAEFLRTLTASNRKAALMNFHNHQLGEPFDELVKMEAPAEEALLKFRDPALPPLTVPEWADFLVAFFDMQKVGFWFSVWAVEKRLFPMRKALIHYGRVENWEEIRQLCFDGRYPIQGSTETLGIWRAAVDTGGGMKRKGEDGIEEEWSRTQEAYLWLRAHGKGKIFGSKGTDRKEGQAKVRLSVQDKAPKGNGKTAAATRRGLVIWLIDSPRFKDDLFTELSTTLLCSSPACGVESDRWLIAERGGTCPACGREVASWRPTMFLHNETGTDWARQILAEEKHRQKDGSFEWVQVKKDNHYLDCAVGCLALVSPEMGGVNKAPRRDRRDPAAANTQATTAPAARGTRFRFS